MDTNDILNQFKRGLLVLVLLKVLERDQMYVGEILNHLSGGTFETQEGSLYPLLSKLKKEGLVSYQWQESPSGPPRKYYSLTESGRKKLDELESGLDGLNDSIKSLGSSIKKGKS
jgi:PadR family transcriptional regulator PadR